MNAPRFRIVRRKITTENHLRCARYETEQACAFQLIGDWRQTAREYAEDTAGALRRLQQIRISIAAARADLADGWHLEAFRAHCPPRGGEFVLIQVCESDGAAHPLCDRAAYRECLARHVAMARQIGIAAILVAPLRMSIYTPASHRRRELSSCVTAMQEVAADLEVPFVDLQTGGGFFFRLVARELSRQLGSNPNRFIYHHEPRINRALSWWHVHENGRFHWSTADKREWAPIVGRGGAPEY